MLMQNNYDAFVIVFDLLHPSLEDLYSHMGNTWREMEICVC